MAVDVLHPRGKTCESCKHIISATKVTIGSASLEATMTRTSFSLERLSFTLAGLVFALVGSRSTKRLRSNDFVVRV